MKIRINYTYNTHNHEFSFMNLLLHGLSRNPSQNDSLSASTDTVRTSYFDGSISGSIGKNIVEISPRSNEIGPKTKLNRSINLPV